MFRSFFLAGFECATGYNRHGQWIDQIAATHHDTHVREDYRRLSEVGIHAIRDGVRWPMIDRGRRYDFSSLAPFLDAAREYEIEVIWDLFHYGYPDGLDLFSRDFPRRFADYCYATAEYVCTHGDAPFYFTPINEPSYFSWAAGDSALFAPHARERGSELKVALARASILAIDAIRAACPTTTIVNVDPLCHVVPPRDRPDLAEAAHGFNEYAVFEFLDMLSGRRRPELGGDPRYLGVIGLNYYWTNQWELGREGTPLADDDPRRVPLGDLVFNVWKRYGTRVLIAETGALGEARGPWVHELARIAEGLLDDGVPLAGICLYPILGMPEWHAREEWARFGLWDLDCGTETLTREACMPMLEALREAQRLEGRVRRHAQRKRSCVVRDDACEH